MTPMIGLRFADGAPGVATAVAFRH